MRTLDELKSIDTINSSFYDEDYYVHGGIVYNDEHGNKVYSGYLGKNWDGGWVHVMNGLIATFGRPNRILEIGADVGSLIDFLIRNNYCDDIIGIDSSPYAINHPMGMAKGHTMLANVKNIPFPDNHFDLVIGFDIWEHLWIDELPRIIREVDRVARKHMVFLIPLVVVDKFPFKSFCLKKTDKISEITDQQLLRQLAKGHITMMPRSWWEQQFIWNLNVDKLNRFKLHANKDKLGLAWSDDFLFVYSK